MNYNIILKNNYNSVNSILPSTTITFCIHLTRSTTRDSHNISFNLMLKLKLTYFQHVFKIHISSNVFPEVKPEYFTYSTIKIFYYKRPYNDLNIIF